MGGQEIAIQVVTTVLTVGPLLLGFRISLEHRLTKLETNLSNMKDDIERLFSRRKRTNESN